LIDPIDGTTNYQYDLPGYAVSIAALAGDRRCRGCLHPGQPRAVHGDGGRSAKLTDPHPVRHVASIQHALVATGFSYQIERRREQALRVAQIIPRIRDIRRFGAAAADLCYLACGRLDVYYEQWLGPWDWAAGELIAREAGCRTGRFDGSPIDSTGVLAANPALFDQMVELLAVTEPGRDPGIM
jgi:myo-inositol-1(or 4)-monophosphatase